MEIVKTDVAGDTETPVSRTLITKFGTFAWISVLPTITEDVGWLRVGIIDKNGIRLDNDLIDHYGHDPKSIRKDVDLLLGKVISEPK